MLLIIVHRLLQSFLFPPLNAMLITLFGLIILKFHKKLGIFCIIFSVFFLYIQSIQFTASLLSKFLELPPLTAQQFESSQAIVVLGGGISNNGKEYPFSVNVSQSTAMRLNYTAFLAKQDPNKLIITSGGYTGGMREADVMQSFLINFYDIKNTIIPENQSRNTDENAKFVAKILLPMNIKNVTVVTQAYHMRRAMMLFKKYGLNPYPGSTDYSVNYNGKFMVLAFIPTAKSMSNISTIYHEILGYVFDQNS